MNVRLLFFISLFAAFQPSYAAVYTWTDANGQVHFSDSPQSDSSKRIDVKNSPARQDVEAHERHQKIVEFVGQQEKEREARKAEELKARKLAEGKARNCRKLKARLVHMESISTFYRLNDQGQRQYVSEAENTRIRERFSAKVRETCGEE